MDSNFFPGEVPRAGCDACPPGLKPLVFATHHLPPHQQAEAWAEAHRPFIESALPADLTAGFAAEMSTWTLGPFALKRTRSPAMRYTRDRAQVRRDQIDHWFVSYLQSGSLTGQVDGVAATATAVAGIPYLYGLQDSCVVDRSAVDWIMLYVPRDAAPELGPALEACRLQALDGPTGRLLGSFLVHLAAELPALTAADLPRVVEATRALLAAAVAPGRDGLGAGRAQIEAVQLTRIKALIRENLRSPRLNPERICRLAGVSRSQLYRLFEPLGGVAHHIQTERLRQVHRVLADPLGTREIHRVAEDAGFYDASTFSRAFRREFGYAPSELRAAMRTGGIPPADRGEAAAAGGRLTDLLRAL